MRKPVYPLAAILYLSLSFSCLAQSQQQMDAARAQYKDFNSWYNQIEKNFSKSLKAVKEAKTKADLTKLGFDNMVYKGYRDKLGELKTSDLDPLVALNQQFPNVRGIVKEPAEIEKMKNEVGKKYNDLISSRNQIDNKLGQLGV